MNKIVVVTDSTCDLLKEQIEENHIVVLPLHVSFSGENKDYLDGVDINSTELYKKVEETKSLPKTGALNVGELMTAFKKILDEGDSLIYTGIGNKLSSTFANTVLAKEELGSDKIALVDSKNLSTGIGLLVLKMCKLRDEGKSLEEIKDTVQKLADNVSTKFCIDRLDYLYKGGRCSGMTRLVAHTFSLHPIAKMIDGQLKVYKLPRGKYMKSIDLQVDEFMKDLPNIDMDHVFITHSGRMEGIENYVYEKLKPYVPEGHLHITEAGCTISSHCGPKTLGILYIVNK